MACGVDDPDSAGPGTKLTKLTATEAEPNGDHCAAGGVAVHSGVDTNDNGVLEQSEISATTYTCSHKTLLREDNIGSGPVCPGGGVLVRSGHDVNDNGSLEDSEIENTATVCYSDELFHGDLKTSDFSTDDAKEKLSHVRIVTGNVVIDSDAPMPKLEMVGGNIDVRVGSLVELPALGRIAGNLIGPPPLVINGDTSVEHSVKIKTPVLAGVGGYVSMTSWKDSGAFDAPALATVDGELFLNGSFSAVDLHQLKRVGGRLDLDRASRDARTARARAGGGTLHAQRLVSKLDLHTLKATGSFDLVY